MEKTREFTQSGHMRVTPKRGEKETQRGVRTTGAKNDKI